MPEPTARTYQAPGSVTAVAAKPGLLAQWGPPGRRGTSGNCEHGRTVVGCASRYRRKAVLNRDLRGVLAKVAKVPYLAFTLALQQQGSTQSVDRARYRNATPAKLDQRSPEACSPSGGSPRRLRQQPPPPLVGHRAPAPGHPIVEQVIGATSRPGLWRACPAGSPRPTPLGSVAGRDRVRPDPRHRGGRRRDVHPGRGRNRASPMNTPARVSRSGRRRQRLHLPKRWPWASQWQALWTTVMTT